MTGPVPPGVGAGPCEPGRPPFVAAELRASQPLPSAHRRCAALLTGAAAAAGAAVLFLWAPWVTVSVAPDGLGDSGGQLSVDGLHTFAAGASTSFPGLLFLLACAGTVAVCLAWVRVRDHRLAVAAVTVSACAAAFALINLGYLYSDTLSQAGSSGALGAAALQPAQAPFAFTAYVPAALSVSVGFGPVMAILGAAVATALSAAGLCHIRRQAVSSPPAFSAQKQP